jgi:nucleoside triphosphate pyrophosphatase
MRLVLASSSPRRAELLRAADFEFEIAPASIDERARPDERPADYVMRLASEKAGSVQSTQPCNDCFVLGADTAVVVDDEILGKPESDADAARMLARLSGRSHHVLTGVSVRHADREVGAVESTTVWFTELTSDEVTWYVRSGEGRDKAGAYAIQGRAARFIPRIDGSYSNVVGLPIALVQALIAQLSSA